MKLIFISSGQYPDGGAAANRHLAYSKGLKELGHDIQYILLKKQKWQGNNFNYNNIQFICVNEKKGRLLKIKKLKLHFDAIKKAQKLLTEAQNEKNISAVIFLDTQVSVLIPLMAHAKKLGLKIFHERTEYPSVVSKKSISGRINLSIYLHFVVRRFDGIYVINNALKKYFSSLTHSAIEIVNMIVDPSRFEQITYKTKASKTVIAYCGTLDNDKDGVPILIRSFAAIARDFPLVTLQIIGSLNNKITRQKMDSLVQELDIEKRVHFTGLVSREEIPQLLMKADILALARPNNKQAEGGFPTKLGEYLATGNPVVITNVGEISLFLKDKVNAFIAKPDSIDSFAEKLREALSHHDRAQIGLAGKKLVDKEFNYFVQAQKLEKFIVNTIKSSSACYTINNLYLNEQIH